MSINVRRKSPRGQGNSGSSLELQKYIDTFNKELEENEGLIGITQKVENDDDNVEVVQETQIEISDEINSDEAGTYFVDESGQIYFQPANTEEVNLVSNLPSEVQILPDDGLNNADGDDNGGMEELNYVYVVTEDNEEEGQHVQDDNAVEKNITVYDFDEEESAIIDTSAIEPSYVEDDKSNIVKVKQLSTSKCKKVFECTMCEYSNSKKFLLKRHMKVHSQEKPHTCSVCSKTFRTAVSLNNHENTHTGMRPHKCSSCKAAFATVGELVRHVRYRHTKIKPHKCDECDYAAVEYSKLRRHQRCHSGERPYQCPHCTYASPDTFKLKRHLRVHTGERPYSCDLCPAAFSQSNSLKAHRLTHFPDRKPVFQCALCPAKCGRKADLRGHIRLLHTATEPIECKKCGKRLPDRYSYKMHNRTHDGEKSFKCDICTYASISQLHLASHMLIHTNEKPYCCDLCDQKFRQKQLLRRHKNLYHNPDYIPPKPRPKNHECSECGKKFIHQGNLIRHFALHDPDSKVHHENMLLKIGRRKKVKGAEEINETEIIVENDDAEDGQYVVFEMIQLEEDGQETVRIINPVEEFVEKKPIIVKDPIDTKADMENCFGFDEEEDDGSQVIMMNENNDDDDDDDDEEEDVDE